VSTVGSCAVHLAFPLLERRVSAIPRRRDTLHGHCNTRGESCGYIPVSSHVNNSTFPTLSPVNWTKL
jgi:hypothetical protein